MASEGFEHSWSKPCSLGSRPRKDCEPEVSLHTEPAGKDRSFRGSYRDLRRRFAGMTERLRPLRAGTILLVTE